MKADWKVKHLVVVWVDAMVAWRVGQREAL